MFTSTDSRKNRSVLVVDDEYSLRISLSMILKRAGYRVQTASSVRQACELLSSERFDLVFLDMKLPDGMGVDLLPQIRQCLPSPRIIIFSATPLDTVSVNWTEAGVSIYLEKPCDPQDILQAANRVLSA